MDIEYFNARVRGMRWGLFRASDYEIFLRAPSEADYRERLRATPYARHVDMAEARNERAAQVIPSAVGSNAADAFKNLWKMAPDNVRRLIKPLFSKWEAHKLKALIRGFAKDVKREDIRGVLVPAGEFNAPLLNALAGSKDLAGAARLLETWGSPYAAVFRDVPLDGHINTFELELKLDSFVCGRLLSTVKGGSANAVIIREMLLFGIDAQNIMTLVKTVGNGFSKETIEGFFIEGGSALAIDKALFTQAVGMKSAQDILDTLARGVKDAGLKAILAVADAEEPAALEEAMDAAMEVRLRKAAVTGPLTIAVAASFIYMKVREMKNLRLIAKAKLFGIPPEELKGLLIYRQ